jgi:hypothetical protein
VNIAASLFEPARAVRPRPRGARRAGALPVRIELAGRPEVLAALGGDHVAHGNSAAVASMELEALDEPRIRKSLQSPLRRRDRPPAVEPPVDLGREEMAEAGDQGEDLDV